MKRFLLYLFPALIDLLVGSFFFVSTFRVAESADATPLAVGLVMTLWGVCYMVASFYAGRIVTVDNCRALMMGGCVGIAACAAAFLIAPSLFALYPIMMVFGISVAFFFPPYQVFMKSVEGDSHGNVASSVATYTVAWSLGLAAGPYVAATVWDLWGWQMSIALDIVLAIATLVGLWLFTRLAHAPAPAAAPAPGDVSTSTPGSVRPNLIMLAWFGTGACLFAMSLVRAAFPSSAVDLNVPKPDQGIALALLCVGQAAVALVLIRGRTWMYRAGPVALFGALGLAGLVLFGLARTSAAFYVAALLCGVYAGSAFIYLVYHALMHPTKAGRYVGINEALVGLTGIIAPAAGGFIGQSWTLSTPYFAVAALVALALVVQIVVHLRLPRTA